MMKIERNILQPGRLITVYHDQGSGEEISIGSFKKFVFELEEDLSSGYVIIKGIEEGITGINLESVKIIIPV